MSLYDNSAVRTYLLNRYAAQFQNRGLTTDQVNDDFDLLKEGIIDSLGIMELVTGLETHFGSSIDFEELDAEHMTVIGPLAAHVHRKLIEAKTNGAEAPQFKTLPTARFPVKGNPVEAWLALDEQSIRRGLMGANPADLSSLDDGAERGMLFVFDSEQPLSFWMFKTSVPLDIIYVDKDQRIINTCTAQPLETRLLYPSRRPGQYVLEVKAGLAARWKLQEGDALELPDLTSIAGVSR